MSKLKKVEKRLVETANKNQLPTDFFKKSHDLVYGKMALTPIELDLMALFLARLSEEQWDFMWKTRSASTTPGLYLYDRRPL